MAIDFGTSHISVTIGPPIGDSLATVKAPVAYTKPANGPSNALELDPPTALKLVTSDRRGKHISKRNIWHRSYLTTTESRTDQPRRPGHLRHAK
jgi:hypothetical protein